MKITPEWLDKWRIWPRMILTFYGIAFYDTTTWYMALPDPTNAQLGFVTALITGVSVVLGVYLNVETTSNSSNSNSK